MRVKAACSLLSHYLNTIDLSNEGIWNLSGMLFWRTEEKWIIIFAFEAIHSCLSCSFVSIQAGLLLFESKTWLIISEININTSI